MHISKTRIAEILPPPFPRKPCISAILLTPDLFLRKHLDIYLSLKHHLKQVQERIDHGSSLIHFIQSPRLKLNKALNPLLFLHLSLKEVYQSLGIAL